MVLDERYVRLAVGLGPWNVPGREAGETVRVSTREARERGRGSLEPWSGSAGETVGPWENPWENPWESRGAVEGTPWEQVRGSSSGNRAGAVATGVQRGIAAGEHKEIKINSLEYKCRL